PNWEQRGQFGDMFGAVNAFFSGLALVGIVYNIILQRKELRLQRQELDRSFQLQNALFNAQLLRDRFDAYMKTYEPVSDEQVANFRLYPDDFMDRKMYEDRYSNDDGAIKRYIHMSQLYEYLAFTLKLRDIDIPDLLGPEWVKRWTEDLLPFPEFRDVHEQYRGYYPEYQDFVDEIRRDRPGGI
ncbi:MAG: hypothetical protein VKL41_04250, partial [Snowella sp.]|nr:hypothetical protein [Snowella sp.]